MATYFIKTGGSDALAGTSDALAWATIAKLNAFAFAPGDIIQFREGDSWVGLGTQLYSANHNGVTFRPYDPATGLPGTGARPILSNTTPSTVVGAPTGVSNLVLDRLEIKTPEAVTGPGQSTLIANDSAGVNANWTIKNCLIHQCGGSGIRIGGNAGATGWTIQDNSIYDCGDNGILINAGNGGSHIVQRNTIYNIGGFNNAQGRHGIYANGPSTIIRNNTFHDTVNTVGQAISLRKAGQRCYGNYVYTCAGGGIGLFANGDVTAGTIFVYSNRIRAATAYGIYVGDAASTFFDSVIASNTIDSPAGSVGIDVGDILHANAVVKNNIVIGGLYAFFGHNAALDGGKETTENNDCFYNQSSATPFKWRGTFYNFANYKAAATGMGTASITTDPATSGADSYTPLAGSPVIDLGTTSVDAGLTYSLSSGDIVYVGSAPDMGATEYQPPAYVPTNCETGATWTPLLLDDVLGGGPRPPAARPTNRGDGSAQIGESDPIGNPVAAYHEARRRAT